MKAKAVKDGDKGSHMGVIQRVTKEGERKEDKKY